MLQDRKVQRKLKIESNFTTSSSGAWTPKDLGGVLKLWVRADQGIVDDGDGDAASWADLSGSGNDLTAVGVGPQITLNSYLTFTALKFTGTQYMTNSSNALMNIGNFTCYCFVRLNAIAGNRMIYGHGAPGETETLNINYGLRVPGSQADQQHRWERSTGTDVTMTSGVGFIGGQLALFGMRRNIGTKHVFIRHNDYTEDEDYSGTVPNQNPTGGDDPSCRFYLGQSSEGAQFLQGDVFELVYVDQLLGGPDLWNLENYFNVRYSLGLSI